MLKPGYKTSEIVLTVLAALLPAIASVADYLQPKYAALASSIVVAGYAISRGLAKVPTPIVPPVPPTTKVPTA
jgi:hypothetical protein